MTAPSAQALGPAPAGQASTALEPGRGVPVGLVLSSVSSPATTPGHGSLVGVTGSFAAGIHAVLGRPSDGTGTLVDLVTGRRAPRSGRVIVEGGGPAHDARLRAAIAALGVAPSLPPGSTVADCLQNVMRWRGRSDVGPLRVLDPLDLGGLAERPLRSLTLEQARSVELCLALAHERAALIVLFEPRCDLLSYDAPQVRGLLEARAADGACVLVVTSAPRDAAELGATQLRVLTAGRFVGAPLRGPAADVARGELIVWVDSRCAGGARALATAVGARDEVVSVRWQRARHADEPEPVAVGAVDTAAAARAIAEETTRLGTCVLSLSSAEPSLAELGYWAVAEQQAVAALAAAGASRATPDTGADGPDGADAPAPTPGAGVAGGESDALERDGSSTSEDAGSDEVRP